jgi:hypothetical protein
MPGTSQHPKQSQPFGTYAANALWHAALAIAHVRPSYEQPPTGAAGSQRTSREQPSSPEPDVVSK